jgi:hypothetical protein
VPAGREKEIQGWQDSLTSLMTTVFRRLENFGYRNASLRAFLESDSVKKVIEDSPEEATSMGLLTGGKSSKGSK